MPLNPQLAPAPLKEWQNIARERYETIAQLRAEVARLTAELAEIKNSMAYRTSLVGRLTQELDSLRAQKPVGYADYGDRVEWYGDRPANETDLFARPVPAAQAVPEAMEQHPLRGDEPVGPQAARIDFVRGWNACRDAMLAVAPNPPVSGGDALLYAAEAQRAAK